MLTGTFGADMPETTTCKLVVSCRASSAAATACSRECKLEAPLDKENRNWLLCAGAAAIANNTGRALAHVYSRATAFPMPARTNTGAVNEMRRRHFRTRPRLGD